MSMGMNVNPAKSFGFVRVVTNVVMRDTDLKARTKNGAPVPTARNADVSPQDIGNASTKKSVKTQAAFTPHDRLIDLVI